MIEAALAETEYERSMRSTANARGIEYQIFSRVTKQLASINTNTKAPDYYPKLMEAAYRNLRLWKIIAADVANEKNELPDKLKSELFYLAEFTRRHTAKVFAHKADAKMLIEINTMIMRGLRGDVAQEGAE